MSNSREKARGFPSKRIRPVVSCLIKNANDILILKRSQLVGSFQGYWSCVSGYRETTEEPLATAFREVAEEIKIEPHLIHPANSAGPFYTEMEEIVFESHWFLFETEVKEISLDWEHEDSAWIKPVEILQYKTVPWLPKLASTLLGKSTREGANQ